MDPQTIREKLKLHRVWVEFKADDGRVLRGEVMDDDDVPEGHFAVAVGWSTWYVTPDVMARYLDPAEVVRDKLWNG